MSSRLVYTTRTDDPNHAAMVERIHAATLRRQAPQYLSLTCDGPCCVTER